MLSAKSFTVIPKPLKYVQDKEMSIEGLFEKQDQRSIDPTPISSSIEQKEGEREKEVIALTTADSQLRGGIQLGADS